jgi:hypothetical protein
VQVELAVRFGPHEVRSTGVVPEPHPRVFNAPRGVGARIGLDRQMPHPTVSGADRNRDRPTDREHPVQDVAAEKSFGFLRFRMTSPPPPPDDRLEPEEGVLGGALVMVSRLLVPSPPSSSVGRRRSHRAPSRRASLEAVRARGVEAGAQRPLLLRQRAEVPALPRQVVALEPARIRVPVPSELALYWLPESG